MGWLAWFFALVVRSCGSLLWFTLCDCLCGSPCVYVAVCLCETGFVKRGNVKHGAASETQGIFWNRHRRLLESSPPIRKFASETKTTVSWFGPAMQRRANPFDEQDCASSVCIIALSRGHPSPHHGRECVAERVETGPFGSDWPK